MPSEFRKDPEDAAVNSGHYVESTVIPPVQTDGGCDDDTVLRVKRSLRRRNGIDYSIIDYSSEEELDHNKRFKTHQSKHSQKANDVRGRSLSLECEEVNARWVSEGACRPIVDEAPVFYPTEEDFRDTLGYISSIRRKAEKYGICRIVPPPSWNPSCPLKEKSMWEQAQFSTRVQQVDKLQNREPMRKRSRSRLQRKRKRRKRLRFGMSRRRNNSCTTDTNDCSSDTEEKFGFQSGSDFTFQSFQIYADDFKEQYFCMRDAMDIESLGDEETVKRRKPSVEEIEGEYWRIVENPTDEIEVLYGADLETGIFGSGFPRAKSTIAKDLDPHVYSGWNLNNFSRLPGSLLCFEGGDISGVLVPWLYIAMCFSSFCWHVEDHHLYSLNYLHWGDPKIWYGVPGIAAVKLEEAMKKHLPELFDEQPDLLHELVTQLSPSVLKSEGVPVYRAIQNAGEFVLTFPRAYHSGFNCGFNCAEAVNVAPMDWLPHGQCAVELYSEQHRKTSISHDKLLMGAAREAIRAQWEVLILGLKSSYNLRMQSFCGKDGMLTKAMRARVEMERARREACCGLSQARKMDEEFDFSNEKECFYCFYDLHLSAAGCECSLDRYACLNHSVLLCPCEPDRRFFLFRYSINEMNMMVEALEGCLDAVQHWGSFDMGLILPSKVAESIDQKQVNPICESASRVCSEKTTTYGMDVEISGSISEVLGASLQNPEACCLTNVKKELESGNTNRINQDSACRQQPELICSQIAPKEKGILASDNKHEEKPCCSLNVYQEDLSNDSKAGIQVLPDRTCGANKGSKVEQDLTEKVAVTQGLTTGICIRLEGEDVMECESKRASNATLRSTPVGGSSVSHSNSLELSPSNVVESFAWNGPSSSSNDNRDTNQSRTKLFGIDLQQHQSLTPSNLYFGDKQPWNKNSPSSVAVNPSDPVSGKVIIRSKPSVEPVQLGTVVFGKKWCNRRAIFPKGFRSRVMYLSVLNPKETCSYVSEVVDAGLIGPLFKVSLESSPENSFLHASPSQCWELVRERLNQEIISQKISGKLDLPRPQPFGSINGLEMFGFLSPFIIQMVESLDPHHRCLQYWASKPSKRSPNEAAENSVISSTNTMKSERWDSITDDEVYLGSLFRKASLEELQVMHRIFSSGCDSDFWKEAHRALLNEKVQKEEERATSIIFLPWKAI